VGSRRRRQLCIERFAVSHTAAQELWPVRHRWQWILLIGQQSPQCRVMPAQFVARAVTMHTNTATQLFYFGNQLLARHPLNVFVHDISHDMGNASKRARRRLAARAGLLCQKREALGRESGGVVSSPVGRLPQAIVG
jgi:hypothetical protein